MLYTPQANTYAPSMNANYVITYDTLLEKFEDMYPIVLENRVSPQQFSETIARASQIMREHMSHIQTRPLRTFLAVFGIIMVATMLLTAVPLLIYFLAYADNGQYNNGWWVWIAFPMLYVFVIIGITMWSIRRRQLIVKRHAQCKADLHNFLQSENQNKYMRMGVQFVLNYNTSVIMGNRYTTVITYKHLISIPSIALFVSGGNAGMVMVPVVGQPQQPIMAFGQAGYQQQAMPYQPPTTATTTTPMYYTQPTTQSDEKLDQPLMQQQHYM
ncbi:hypothetical protein C9374_001834 [Naegleria lovaniensis]|uniref:Uncharacterized protein n=1 Tax=Naegleria lovaniensis TaxID=51637 RepID=A0AA88KMB7_NAELO|nr:uncharacterized protein C9374_001834 [Naegleria lovaniensis]KAG2386799.1 hypothetical protein C9374_001834 [Naegleria lovaniensis]